EEFERSNGTFHAAISDFSCAISTRPPGQVPSALLFAATFASLGPNSESSSNPSSLDCLTGFTSTVQPAWASFGGPNGLLHHRGNTLLLAPEMATKLLPDFLDDHFECDYQFRAQQPKCAFESRKFGLGRASDANMAAGVSFTEKSHSQLNDASSVPHAGLTEPVQLSGMDYARADCWAMATLAYCLFGESNPFLEGVRMIC
ncbi:unnamed protein product, partial [Protopolystoma xenopodis]